MKLNRMHLTNRATRIFAATMAFFMIFTAVFCFNGLTVSAYSASDLAAAEKAEAQAREAYYSAKANADRLNQSTSRLVNYMYEEEHPLLKEFAAIVKKRTLEVCYPTVDGAIDDIADIYSQDRYSPEQKRLKAEAVLDAAAVVHENLMAEFEALIDTYLNRFITEFNSDIVDYSSLWDSAYNRIVLDIGYIDFELWMTFYFISDTSEIESRRAYMHEIIDERMEWTQEAILFEIPSNASSCVYITKQEYLNDGKLEETWQRKLRDLLKIRQAINNYDYSVTPSFKTYTQGSNAELVFNINGDFDAVYQVWYFDMQASQFYDEASDTYSIASTLVSDGVQYTLERGENDTITVKLSNKFLDKHTQGDHVFRLYYNYNGETDIYGWDWSYETLPYVEFGVMMKSSDWVEITTFDDGQDWEPEPEDTESEAAQTVENDETEAEQKDKTLSPLTAGLCILGALLLAIIILIIILIKKKKMNTAEAAPVDSASIETAPTQDIPALESGADNAEPETAEAEPDGGDGDDGDNENKNIESDEECVTIEEEDA